MVERVSGGVQSVERAFYLLELLADNGDLSLTELSASIELPAPTTHRFLKTLVSLGYVRQLSNRRYGLGLGLVRLAGRVDAQFGPIAKPHLDTLAKEIGESANLAVLDGDRVVYIAQSPSPHPMRMFTEVGHRAHTHSTGVGKAILAQLPDDQVARIVQRAGLPPATDRTITDAGKLRSELNRIRRAGYATDNGEQENGVCCYAVAVPDVPISMAISVSGPAFRMTKELGKAAVPLLHREAKAISQELLGVLE
ncbi:IclR family transcriptional regulator [Microlunatus sp. Gsoil 973]|uniref:IclR family transcriptional regulator n=1 Tax=Microlunatus sp. Gsoil 973 TaxID=2672569 RepID=UPI0012B4A3A3|nr:IclR family transcriptional regulator [Microlunatus sp. Gsoil 973]QGN34952.1 helix-turn-helix domain-containing protein [Microlunatus sp. Gsoil 973]